MNQANLARLESWSRHGEPKGYGGSDMMRDDLRALLAGLEAAFGSQRAEFEAVCWINAGDLEAMHCGDDVAPFFETCLVFRQETKGRATVPLYRHPSADSRGGERYRWLRDNFMCATPTVRVSWAIELGSKPLAPTTEQEIDAAIDAAIKRDERKED